MTEEVVKNATRLGLTLGERWGLIVLASNADEHTRLTFHHANHPEILQRVGVAPDAWRNVRTALVRKHVLEVVLPGRRGRAAMYRIPNLSVLSHPADAEQPMADQAGPGSGPMAHPGDAESIPDGAPDECGIDEQIPHFTGAESGPIPHPGDAESTAPPFFSSTPPPPRVSADVPPVPQQGAEVETEEEGGSFELHHVDQAYAIMETLTRLPVRQGNPKAIAISVAIAKRLAIGISEAKLRERIDRPLPGPIEFPYAFLLARVMEIPLRAPSRTTPRPADVGLAEVGEALGGTFARTGERPGAIDIAAVPGGWRGRMQQRGESGDEG